ncbi:MAG TPA: hydroxymethylbilane synthase [Hyphomicrobiaceae bacterium]|nr:hydroxymethylbilane synthase [Hyphomicrobiaceae bacterium]
MQAANTRTSIRIGTRGSPLAMAQAQEVRRRLMAAHGLPEQRFEIRPIKTSGDRLADRPLADAGGKGLFTKEIEDALIDHEIDLAVHSMKDMTSVLPAGLAIGAVLERADVRDAFISLKYPRLADLPAGAVVGTSSLRRRAFLARMRPDLRLVHFRGNVDTRLAKLEAGLADATVLAAAGLERLHAANRITALIPVEDMLPAVAQGAIAVQVRDTDQDARRLLAAINHEPTALCVAAERAFLARLDGSCRTPIAGLARLDGARLQFRGMVLAPDGSTAFEASRSGSPAAALALGEAAAEEVLSKAGPAFLAGLR